VRWECISLHVAETSQFVKPSAYASSIVRRISTITSEITAVHVIGQDTRPLRKKAFYANEENIFFVVELGAVSEFEHSDIRVEQPGTHDGGSGSIQVIEACHSRPR